jgi:hypothetical protein
MAWHDVSSKLQIKLHEPHTFMAWHDSPQNYRLSNTNPTNSWLDMMSPHWFCVVQHFSKTNDSLYYRVSLYWKLNFELTDVTSPLFSFDFVIMIFSSYREYKLQRTVDDANILTNIMHNNFYLLIVFYWLYFSSFLQCAFFVNDDAWTFMLLCLRFYYYHCVDTSAGGLLVHEDIIPPVVRISALTWFTRYIHHWNLQFLNNVIIIKTKVLLPKW